MNESKFVLRVLVGLRRGKHLELGIWKASRLLPEIDTTFCARRTGHYGLLRAGLTFGFRANVLHVIASNLVLRAIPALRAG